MAETDDVPLEELEETETPGLSLGPLPRFPSFGRRPASPPETAPPAMAAPEPEPEPYRPPASPPPVEGPSAKPSVGSSRASTEVVDLKDLQAAIREATDMAFVNVGQGFGYMEKRAKGLPAIDPKWVPTKTERALVSEPAARIAKRHMHADVTALDTIDGLMIAVGLGGFVTKRAFNIDPLEENQP